jgi:hypothetical protein
MIWETCSRGSSVPVSGVTTGSCELGNDYLGCVRATNVRFCVLFGYSMSQFPTACLNVWALDYSTYAFRRSFNADISVSSVNSVIKGQQSVATRYGLDGPGIESRWGARFSVPVQTGPGVNPASYTVATGSLSRG